MSSTEKRREIFFKKKINKKDSGNGFEREIVFAAAGWWCSYRRDWRYRSYIGPDCFLCSSSPCADRFSDLLRRDPAERTFIAARFLVPPPCREESAVFPTIMRCIVYIDARKNQAKPIRIWREKWINRHKLFLFLIFFFFETSFDLLFVVVVVLFFYMFSPLLAEGQDKDLIRTTFFCVLFLL